jgi:putative transposase
MREVMNAVFYLLRTGCQWDYLPKCFPPKSTVYDYFSQWRDDGVLDDIALPTKEWTFPLEYFPLLHLAAF